jgi:hypothetical protein
VEYETPAGHSDQFAGCKTNTELTTDEVQNFLFEGLNEEVQN